MLQFNKIIRQYVRYMSASVYNIHETQSLSVATLINVSHHHYCKAEYQAKQLGSG